MMTDQSSVARLRLDERLDVFRPLPATVPRLGWLRAIRKALGMTREQLARRVGVTQSTIAQLERSEGQGTIQIDSLRRVATAMDCELLYVIVPRKPLTRTVEDRLDELAEAKYLRTAHSMALENQLEDDAASRAIKIKAIRDAISMRDVWRE